MNCIRALLFFAAALTLHPDANAALTMQVDFDIHEEAVAAGVWKIPPDTHRATTITLDDQRIVIAGPDATTIYDFATRRRHVIDRASQTRVEYSLYDTVGFRALEYSNRIGIARALAAAKIDDGTMSIDQEHALSFQASPSTPLTVATDATDRTFSFGSRVFARTSLHGTPVDPASARMFAQVLRYGSGGHPQILASIAASNAIADRLVLITRQGGLETTQTISVRAIRQATETPLDPATVPQRSAAVDTDPLDRALDRAIAFTPADLDAAKRRGVDDVAAAWQEKRTFDALLGIAEVGLTTGDAGISLTPEQRALVGADAAAVRFLGAIPAKSKEQVVVAIPVLEALGPTTTKPYLLDIFIANDRKTLGQAAVAKDLFVKVLVVNPLLTSVYKDLGDALLMGFDVPRAWRSWDAGRRIVPRLPNFAAVDQFEQSLASRHPEYF